MNQQYSSIRSLKRVRKAATAALKGGRLHPDRWAEVDDLVLDGQLIEAANLLVQHTRQVPAYPTVPGAREFAIV
jgi:hypothetical protein